MSLLATAASPDRSPTIESAVGLSIGPVGLRVIELSGFAVGRAKLSKGAPPPRGLAAHKLGQTLGQAEQPLILCLEYQ